MRNGSSVQVRLPSELGFEKVAMSTAASMAALMGFTEDRIEDLKTAVAEACINAIEHGNQLNDSLTVGVVLSTSEDRLEVKVIDDGAGVNGCHLPQLCGNYRLIVGRNRNRRMHSSYRESHHIDS